MIMFEIFCLLQRLKMTSRAVIASLATTKRGNPKNYHKIQINSKFNPTQHPKFKQNSHSPNQPPANPLILALKSTQIIVAFSKFSQLTLQANRISSSLKPRTTRSKLYATQTKPNPKTHITHTQIPSHAPHKSPQKNLPKTYISSPSFRHSS